MTAITFKRIAPTPASDRTPLPRSSHGLSALDGGRRLVLYGGENVARTPITEQGQSLWFAERGEGGSWRWLSPAKAISSGAEPSPRVAHAQAAVGNAVYVFGGRNGIDMGENSMNDLWRMEIVSPGKKEDGDGLGKDVDDRHRFIRWIEVIPADGGEKVPEARSFHKMISVGTDLYVFGGCGAGGRLNDLWKFDTVAKVWTNLGSSEHLRGRGGPNVLSLKTNEGDGAKIVIVAGFAGEETNDGHVFSGDDGGGWSSDAMGDLLDGLRKRSVCSFGSLPDVDKCVIFGGEVSPSDRGHEGAGGFADDLVLLDGSTGKYLESVRPKEGEEWPTSRGWADGAVGGDTFYIFGGLTGDDKNPERLDDLWECQVSS